MAVRRGLDIALIVIFVLSVAALFLAHEDPFARDAVCERTGFCPAVPNAKAWNKILYDLAIGALVSLFFYLLVVRLPDYQKRQRLKKNLANRYKSFKEDCIAIMLMVTDGTFEWGFHQTLIEPDKFRDYFTEPVSRDQERWHAFQNKLDEYHLKELIKRMEVFRDDIAYVLNNVYIPGDEPFEFLRRLSAAIYSIRDTTLGYDDTKQFAAFLFSVFAAFDNVTGYQKEDVVKKMIDAI